MTLSIATKNLKRFEERFQAYPELTLKAASLAINDVTRMTLATSTNEMMSQVNLPRRYIRERLKVIQYSNPYRLEAIIQGRQRATSLFRFDGKELGLRKGVRVRVKAGKAGKTMKRAFLLKLKNGNKGLAVRLKRGDKMENKGKTYSNDPGLYLLYGPSVQQVFQSVAPEIEPQVTKDLEREFNRQFNRLT